MKELNSIIIAFAALQDNPESVFLATIVNVKGSTYRQPGARMLMSSTGNMVGTISGGCLENDVFEHTRVSMPDGKSIVVTYDTNADEDIIWGFGLGCNGVVDVLIECLNPDDPLNPLIFIQQCFNNQQCGIIATVFGVEGEVNVQVGARLILNADNNVNTNIPESALNQVLIKDAQEALKNQCSSFHKYQFGSGEVNVFMEFIQPPFNLLIFGAGRDSVPVAEFAKALGWQVTIFDCRAMEATKGRFMMANEVILTRREILYKQISMNENSIAVVMTHNYFDDLEILKLLIPSNLIYVGCLGSKQRTQRLLTDLQKECGEYPPAQLQKLYAPIGLDIGANTPEAIALSIIAEIQAILTQRNGGFLKDRNQPIHQITQVQEIFIEK
ncbi:MULTISPECIES: XdhC family protein [unclassified Anabaena]|uniref:XdhC family protein n=1 Tax=unclassified Anabaena TaxID=2619674 RepID=UPI001444CAAA|nr:MULTISPECIES: XdhC/CoxI family protein [unclassified Anabaena]MTJ06546.1 XdhC family protein [Anabaena sp. UHCC 0204]MTJ54318.1 XdhC family protein [Anabaena sp. UHCC 0253]